MCYNLIFFILGLIIIFFLSDKLDNYFKLENFSCSKPTTINKEYSAQKQTIINNLIGLTIKEAMIKTDMTTTSSLQAHISKFGIIPIFHHDVITGFKPIYDAQSITSLEFEPLIKF